MTTATAHSPPFHAVRLLEFNPLARQDYEEDRIAQFMDSLEALT